jgi:hypothetical protein
LIAGPALGYATAGRPSDVWRGLVLRSAIVSGAAAAGAYEAKGRTGGIARRERTMLVVATAGLGFSELWDVSRLPAAVGRAERLGLMEDAAPRGNTALQISIAGTIAPALIALAPNEGGLAVLGVVTGPAAGYVYDRRTARGLGGIALRAAGAATLVDFSLDDVDITDDPVRLALGSTLLLGSAAYDLWKVRETVEKDTRLGCSIGPAMVCGAPGLVLGLHYY